MIDILVRILTVYVFIGLVFLIIYMTDAGKLISKKCGCSLIKGIFRFGKIGGTTSNRQAGLFCILIWPMLFGAMKRGTWDKVLEKMVDESDYAMTDGKAR